jgi:hypothetical protein
VEEAVTARPDKLFARAATSLLSLAALAQRAGASEPLPPGRATAVDAARCEAMAKRLTAWAEKTPDVTVSVPCDAVVRILKDTNLDDADLLIHMVGSEIVEPVRRAQRKNTPRPLSLLSGRIAPASHRRAAALGVLAGMGETEALRRAVGYAQDDLCLAAVAVWFHAELGDDDAIQQRLAPHCHSRQVSAWTDLAAARPRRALRGLGLGSLGDEAAPKNLEALWWAPLGMPARLADATAEPPPQPEGLEVTIEQLEPPKEGG